MFEDCRVYVGVDSESYDKFTFLAISVYYQTNESEPSGTILKIDVFNN